MSDINVILNSALSTGIAELITLPICTIKTYYQSSRNNISLYDTISEIYNSRGIIGFYKASIPAFSAQVFSSTSKIYLYTYFTNTETLKDYYKTSGILSAILTSIVTHPIDICRITLQNGYTLDKIPFIYQGWSQSFYKSIIGGATFLPIRSMLKENYKSLKSYEINFLSAIISTIIIHPFDFFKTYIIANGNNVSLTKLNCFKGLHNNLMRIVPHFTIMMTTYDYLMAQ